MYPLPLPLHRAAYLREREKKTWQLFCWCLTISLNLHSQGIGPQCMRMSAGLAEVLSPVPCPLSLSGCATYSSATDSRAICNRARPRCSRCAKSNRPCQYGLRLSWPKATNTKRSLTHSIQDRFGTAKSVSQTSFVNATSWDIQLHHYLRMNQGWLSHGICLSPN